MNMNDVLDSPEIRYVKIIIQVGSSNFPCGVQVVEECHQLTPDTVMAHFLFSVPQSLPVSIATPLVSLRWVLRFEFTLHSRAQGGGWGFKPSASLPQQMTWLLPVLVRPPGL